MGGACPYFRVTPVVRQPDGGGGAGPAEYAAAAPTYPAGGGSSTPATSEPEPEDQHRTQARGFGVQTSAPKVKRAHTCWIRGCCPDMP